MKRALVFAIALVVGGASPALGRTVLPPPVKPPVVIGVFPIQMHPVRVSLPSGAVILPRSRHDCPDTRCWAGQR